ncbi:MAG: HD domain-containing protein [Chloroflexota bacterium]|nr:HD domain-containing protein [Chloroflexota bacterium]
MAKKEDGSAQGSTNEDSALTPPSLMVADLQQTEKHFREIHAEWERRATELSGQLKEVQFQLASAQKENASQAQDLDQARRQVEQQRKQAERHRERANQLAALLKDIHRSLFAGNIHDLILRACLTITGATRGVYVTAQASGEQLRMRAAVDVDGYPAAAPSDFIVAICTKVLEENDSFVCNEGGDSEGLPQPSRPSESFRNFLAAPVVLLHNLSGIVVVADKLHGDFEEDDVETLLSVGDQAAVAVENSNLRHQIQNAYISTVAVLADAMEIKDPYTQGHCEQVSRYTRLIADHLQLPDHHRSVVCYAALLHDIGKIGVSDGILNKPGPLLDTEREMVRSHAKVGHDLIRHVPELEPVAHVVLHHHEWYDGSGYPDGLKGDKIPLASRIVGAVDAYSAMITKRSYKEAYSEEHAREELRRCAGTQFDPSVVDAFLTVLELPDAQMEIKAEEANCGILPGIIISGRDHHQT